MRYIDLKRIDVTSDEMKDWLSKAAKKTSDVKAIGTHDKRSKYFKKNPIWTDLKPYLKEVYGKVCWYSEADITNEYGDVDHFRPKSMSMDMQKKVILPDGYWWLAYDYTNYRLSCTISNRPSGDNAGKREYFPLKNPENALSPDDNLTKEEPVLLDPCCLYDTTLMGYSADGNPISLSDNSWEVTRVDFSIRAYNLREFSNARRMIHGNCHMVIKLLDQMLSSTDSFENNKDIGECISTMQRFISPGTPYSSVAYFYLMEEIIGKSYETELKDLLNKFYIG